MDKKKTFEIAIERLKFEKKISLRAMCLDMGINYNHFFSMKKGNQNPADTVINRIGEKYPEFFEWIKIEPPIESESVLVERTNNNSNCEEYKERIKFLSEQNAKQLGMIDNTNAELMNLYKKLVEKGIKLD